jgi:hypothetical protein
MRSNKQEGKRMKKIDYENLTHAQSCIIEAQTEYDQAFEAFAKIKDTEMIGGRTANWFVGTGTKELNEAYHYVTMNEKVLTRVCYALKVNYEQAQAMTDGYNRYWMNK